MLKTNLEINESIFALTTGGLPSAVAIVKLSGSTAFEITKKIFFPYFSDLSKTRGMWTGKLLTPEGALIDQIMALTFVSPHSHTGEDSVEFHCHGSVAVVEKLERTLISLGARQATRGEFSYRAYLNAKTSLEDLETLGDVFKAKDQIDLNAIYSRKSEPLQEVVGRLKENLMVLQAILDTSVDFSEEYSNVVHQSFQPLSKAIHECSLTIQAYKRFEHGLSVPKVVIAGRPNAGKSSLFNTLLGKYRAIVHEEAGTTRDAIEEEIYLEGKRFKLVDIAGFRQALSAAEKEGIELGEKFLKESSLWILVVDGTVGISKEEELILERFSQKPHLILWNKMDLAEFQRPPNFIGPTVVLSARTGEGVEELWRSLESLSLKVVGQETTLLPTVSQVKKLEKVFELLISISEGLKRSDPAEMIAEKNRAAMREITDLIGYVDQEEILGKVFSEFCIGK